MIQKNTNEIVKFISEPDMISLIENDSFFKKLSENVKRKRTIKTYKVYQDKYKVFCINNYFNPLFQQTLLLFLKSLVELNKSVSTIKTAYYANLHIFESNTIRCDSYLFRNFFTGLENIKTENNEIIKKKTNAITSYELLIMFPILNDTYKPIVLWLYFGAFRITELLSLNKNDIEFKSNGAYITIRNAKNLKRGRVHIKFIPRVNNINCPVASMESFIKDKPENIFEGFTRNQVSMYISRKFKGCSSHSFRAGFITDAINCGQTLEQICKNTGQTVATAQGYIDNISVDQNNAVSEVAKDFFKNNL